MESLKNRFWSRVEIIPFHECWEWTGSKRPDKYGQIMFEGRVRKAHKVSWFLMTGLWPAILSHACGNGGCVRPSHLYEGYKNSKKTHCIRGHDLNEAHVKEYIPGKFRRICRFCQKVNTGN